MENHEQQPSQPHKQPSDGQNLREASFEPREGPYALDSLMLSYSISLAGVKLGLTRRVHDSILFDTARSIREELVMNERAPTDEQRARRQELVRRFKEYVSDCQPVDESAQLAAVVLSNFYTINTSRDGVEEFFLAELRNRDGRSLLCRDLKLYCVGGGLPIATIVAQPQLGQNAPFSYELLPTREYLFGELALLKASPQEQTLREQTPLLCGLFLRAIARDINLRREAKSGDAALPIYTDEIEILNISVLPIPATGESSFEITTVQGRFQVSAYWSISLGLVSCWAYCWERTHD